MTPEYFAEGLEDRLRRWGLSREKAAEAADCPTGDALRVLQGDPTAPLQAVLALCDVARCDLHLVPRSEPVLRDPTVTEPLVQTKVSAVLQR